MSENQLPYKNPNAASLQYYPQQSHGSPTPMVVYTSQQPGATAGTTAGAVFIPQSAGVIYPPQQFGPPGAAYIHQQPYQTVQPGYANVGVNLNDHCTFSVLNTIFCCFWIGLFAIIKSQAVRDAIRDGNHLAAVEHSRQALKLNKVALGVGIGVNILSIIILGVCFGVILR